MVEGVVDQREEPFDRCGQCHELGDAGSAGPGQPAGEQLSASGSFGCEDFTELLFEQVGAVERKVGLGDRGYGGALVSGEIRRVFQQGSPAVFQGFGLVGLAVLA